VPLAQIAGQGVIDAQDVMNEAERIPAPLRQGALARTEHLKQMVDTIATRRLLAAAAEAAGLDKDDRVQAALRRAREQALMEAMLARIDEQNAPTDAALEKYAETVYRSEPQRFRVPEQVRVAHILIRGNDEAASARAEALLAQLKDGADFAALAREHSEDPATASKGGDLGFFARGRMVAPFEDAAFALYTPGELAGPVKTQFGFHLLRLEARRAEGVRPFEEVREALVAEARTRLVQQARADYIQALKAGVAVDDEAVAALARAHREDTAAGQ
jgi:peptidyl-prolyl cis-trans isomerase C